MQGRFCEERARPRAGITLVEMVGVLTFVTAILSLSAVVLNQAFSAHRAALVHFRYSQQLQRFGDQIRRDIHHSDNVTIDEDSGLVVQINSDKQINYRFDSVSTSLTRDVTTSGKLSGRETWLLPQVAQVEWDSNTEQKRLLISTRIVFDDRANRPAMEWLAVGKELVDAPPPTAE